MRVAVVGAGWAGMAAAVEATAAGHRVRVYEASRTLGGRARAVPATLPDGSRTMLDNGQHILIGAYTVALALMRQVGVNPHQALLRLPLALLFADGGGLQLPRWPAPWDAVAGILRATGWSASDKLSLLLLATRWRLAGFRCPPGHSVRRLCATLSERVMRDMVEPLCVSALNTPADRASGQMFLRVMRDSVFGSPGGSNLLLPRVDLSTLFPDAAARWVRQHGGEIRLGARVLRLESRPSSWSVDGDIFELVVLAVPSSDAVRLVETCLPSVHATLGRQMADWCVSATDLEHEPIATVYAWGRGAALAHPMLLLRSGPAAPAQFVFDRGQLGGPRGLLAFVVSASQGERDALQAQVLAQASAQLGLELQAVQTVVEKRATFACTPGLQRPGMQIAPGLVAGADYVEGPYPSTLEGAVRAGVAAIRSSGSAS